MGLRSATDHAAAACSTSYLQSQQLAKQLLKSEEDTAVAAGLAPQKEGCALLPGTDWRPADILIPRWEAGKDAALDVTVIHPLQDATRAREAAEPSFSLQFVFTL